jgi:hypothetical protein
MLLGLGLGLGLDERGSHTGSHAEARMCWLVLDILCCTFFLGLGLGLGLGSSWSLGGMTRKGS